MTTEITLRDTEGGLTPEEFGERIDSAREKAKRLKDIVMDRKLFKSFGTGDNQSDHLQVEGWQIIGMGYGLSCRTRVTEWVRDGDYRAVKASAELINGDGMVVGGADSYCDNEEDGHKGQHLSQLAGMAQTRAEARAYKENLSWVAELAGYSPTPAEEMAGIKGIGSSHADLICPIHDMLWFKRGKMREYAHPIDGESGPRGGTIWCNMEDALKDQARPVIEHVAATLDRHLDEMTQETHENRQEGLSLAEGEVSHSNAPQEASFDATNYDQLR
jgi:hypothetical protein